MSRTRRPTYRAEIERTHRTLVDSVWNDVTFATLTLFIDTALSISALAVIARILMDLGLIQKELGVIVTVAATINDILGYLSGSSSR